MDNFLAAMGGLCGGIVYIWISAFAWSFVPDGKFWWSFPAGMTTFVLTIPSVMLGVAAGLAVYEYMEARK